MFYSYYQNNTGGSFVGPQCVIIEAEAAEDANILSSKAGVYFDGVLNGIDCSCCGDRWYRTYDYIGDNVPSFYNEPISEATSGFPWTKPTGIIYYLDGTKEPFDINEEGLT